MVMALPWLKQPLADALRTQRGHALLVHGPEGVGQFEFAMALAKAWLCETPADRRSDAVACDACPSCHLVDTHGHPDLLVLVPEALRDALGLGQSDEPATDGEGRKAKPSKEIKVDALRAAVAFSQQTSARGLAKVVVLHPAERMNAISANTLLKTLEEPPGIARFVLSCGDAEGLLPTIRSRCQSVRLALPEPALALAWLAEQSVAEPELMLAAAGGQPLSVVDRAALGLDAAVWKKLPSLVTRGEASALSGWPLPLVVESLQKLCHDALLAAHGAAPRYFPAGSVGAGHNVAELTQWAAELRQAARHAEHPWNAGLKLEALILRGQQALSRTSPKLHSTA
ncbi:DNA polymerase III subunit delta' [Methylibium rhizosphaerae]|jgi:DNA polymerase-3 subunit delta'|uniref:DNA polymerase III subunit delta' n=1 Tax=Methylibium rhizosphaerae TaxID=2570323 RepID=UPI00112CF95D|nr:DNA polymerase III subunit delta' [Methylibium rhizosphaerae]